MSAQRIFIFANGDCGDPDFYRRQIDGDDLLICADGGSRHVLAMGLLPHAVIGDNDSMGPALRSKLEEASVQRISDPALDQEKSDLEMALDYALTLRPSEIIICGALGGKRIDHSLINPYLLMIPFMKGVQARIIDEHQTIRLMDRVLALSGQIGDYLSLFSLLPRSTGVTTEGLKYPLQGETLYFASTRGLSNELISQKAGVSMASGLLLAIHTVPAP